jgi:hypothetical protein
MLVISGRNERPQPPSIACQGCADVRCVLAEFFENSVALMAMILN